MPTWVRTQGFTPFNVTHNIVLGTVPEGQTLLRVHAGVRFSARTLATADPGLLMAWGMGCGIYTNITSGGANRYPISDNTDFSPPEQRWLWLEVLYLTPRARPHAGYEGYWTWSAVSAENPIDVKAQVKASAELNLNLSLEQTATTPAVISATSLAYWASYLYGT